MIKKNVFLIGPRACGKTCVGRVLADRLGVDFLDTDHVFVAATGMNIAGYIEQFGWDGFRAKEGEIFEGVASSCCRVVGCGGGIVLRAENRAVLSSGLTLYLKTAPEILAERLMRDPNVAQRPSLTGKSIVAEVREVLRERASLYEACADVVLPQGELEKTVAAALVALNRFS